MQSSRPYTTLERTTKPAAVLVMLVTIAGACAPASSDVTVGDRRPVIVATTSIWADVVSNITCGGSADGGLVQVAGLVPAGTDPHGFEPSLADRSLVQGAAMVVSTGLGLDRGLVDVVEAVEADGTPVFRIAEHTDTIPYGLDGAPGGEADPHLWFDPQRVSAVLPELGRELAAAAGIAPEAVARCVAGYRDELTSADSRIRRRLSALPSDRRRLITNHHFLGYLADRYGLEVIATVVPAAGDLAETNPADLAALAELIEVSGVKVIFTGEQEPADDARALAESAGGELVSLLTGSLGPEGSGADTYLSFLETNTASIAESLGAGRPGDEQDRREQD
ncbi:MAG: metal ABC transporter substrate-binding protein [Acidimicrobiales bacterium]